MLRKCFFVQASRCSPQPPRNSRQPSRAGVSFQTAADVVHSEPAVFPVPEGFPFFPLHQESADFVERTCLPRVEKVQKSRQFSPLTPVECTVLGAA